MRLNLPLLVFSCTLIQAPLSAQMIGGDWKRLHQFDGFEARDFLGSQIAAAGDVDADGIPDVILGAKYTAPGGVLQAGSAFVYSGKSGALLWRFDGAESFGWFGGSTAGVGDIDGDGFGDLLVGAPNQSPGGSYRAGSAYIFSGASGLLIRQFDGQGPYHNFGIAVAGASDLDGDGLGDVIIGAPGADPGGGFAGSTYVYSSATGALIWRFNGIQDGEKMGSAVANVGDVDGDNIDDIAIGAESAAHHGLSFAGAVYVYSGASGDLIWQFDGKAAYDAFGSSVARAGDVNGDQRADLVIGIPGSDSHGYPNAGAALVYCGASGEALWHFTGISPGDQLGGCVSGGGDVDGDGFADVLAGARTSEGNAQLGRAYLWSGATGELIQDWIGSSWGDTLGSAVALIGDLDHNRLWEVAIGAQTADPQGLNAAGSVMIYSLAPFLNTSADELSATIGTSVQLGIDFPDSQADANYVLLASANGDGPSNYGRLAIPLTSDALFMRMLAGWSPAFLQNGRGNLDGQGNSTAILQGDPSLLPFVGTTLTVAVVTFDPGTRFGQLSSIARSLRVVP